MLANPKLANTARSQTPHRLTLRGVNMMHTAELDSAVWCTPGLGILSLVFLVNCLFFANKWWNNDQMSDSLKKMSDSLTFGEWPEWIAQCCSFFVSDLSDKLTSLIFVEQPEPFPHIADYKRGNEGIAHFFKNVQKHTIKYALIFKKLEWIA